MLQLVATRAGYRLAIGVLKGKTPILSDAIRHMHRGFETVTVSHSSRQIEQATPNNRHGLVE
jgi:hypothetical protein